jgi:hypothetical protein
VGAPGSRFPGAIQKVSAMIDIRVDTKELRKLASDAPKAFQRAAEKALDETADAIKKAQYAELPRVFDRPTPYTMGSLKVMKTQRHVLEAKVWFKEPMGRKQHYLLPQVEGGSRPFKGFEVALGLGQFFAPPSKPSSVSGRGARINAYGNISPGQLRQVLSVLGRAEQTAGYSANITAQSAKRNRKPRDYVLIRTRHGNLAPGVYQRYQTSAGFGAKTKRTLGFGEWQKGRTVGKFSSAIRARGLAPVMYLIKKPTYKKRYQFYEIGKQIASQVLSRKFSEVFNASRR